MSIHSYFALYYPLIHFKDDDWLKLSALYWDKMGRIVPEAYEPSDSHTVRELGDYVETLRPGWVRPSFGERFATFVETNGAKLRHRYGVARKGGWTGLPHLDSPAAGSPSANDSSLSYVFYEKMSPTVRELMLDSGIAEPDPLNPSWLGMHPKLAQVYMIALADRLAAERGLFPMTDETLDRLAVGGWTLERLAQALLGDVELASRARRGDEVESAAAYVALKTIVPRDLRQLSVDQILEFRETYPGERARFQTAIRDFINPRAWLADITDIQTLEARLQDEYQRLLQPEVDELREEWREANIDAVAGALSVKVAAPGLAVLGAQHFGVDVNLVAASVAGAALALIPVMTHRRAIKRARSSPYAYLHRAEQALAPGELNRWVRDSRRRFGV